MEQQPLIPYDVFISYNHRDQAWVCDNLLARLEGSGLKVCIDYRDFDIAAVVSKEIERAIMNSRRTLLVLTEEYLNSEWCEYENMLLQWRDPANRMRALIPLLKSQCKLPPRISYLNYANFVDPKDPDLEWKRLLKALAPPAQTTPAPEPPPEANPEQGRIVSEGISLLIPLMKEAQVKEEVIKSRFILQEAQKQVAVLSDYKLLHEALHNLQFQCYNCVLREARRFPDDEVALENLSDYEITLRSIINTLKEVSERPTLKRSESAWVSKTVEIPDHLRAAIEARNKQMLSAVVRALSGVVMKYPAKINACLNKAAGDLPLSELVDALGNINGSISGRTSKNEDAERFRIGISALLDLKEKLVTLVGLHDKWQEVDLELRRVEEIMPRDELELETAWPTLKEMVEALYESWSDSRVVSIKDDSARIEAALRQRDPVNARQYFQRFRRQAGEQFYMVDSKLRNLCEELRIVGDPIAAVLEAIK